MSEGRGWAPPGGGVNTGEPAPAHYPCTPVNPTDLIKTFGTLGLIGIIFAETGLMIGFFLPGDSLLVTAGVLASGTAKDHHGLHLNLGVVLVGCFVAAVIGAEVGYFIGRKAGPALFNRPRSRLFKPEYVDKAQGYFDRYGNRTIVLARFIPIVRTFANPVAGVGEMDLREFTIYNIAGAVVWTIGVTLLGYFIGNSVKDVYLIPAVIVVSLIPIGVEFLRHRRSAGAKTPS
jgi:membrane-associated protein